jgi:hypothetical protein
VPRPESVQWERAEAVADAAHPVFLHLAKLAARGEVLFADDMGVKTLFCLRENKERTPGERTGTHTTGIVAKCLAHARLPKHRSGSSRDSLPKLFSRPLNT